MKLCKMVVKLQNKLTVQINIFHIHSHFLLISRTAECCNICIVLYLKQNLILYIFRIHVCELFYLSKDLYFCLSGPEIYTALLNNKGDIVTWLSFTAVNVRFHLKPAQKKKSVQTLSITLASSQSINHKVILRSNATILNT